MIYDSSTQTIVGNLGWVDRGALWVFDVAGQRESLIEVEGARYLDIRLGSNGLFRVVHSDSPDLAVSIRHFKEPAVERASVRLGNDQVRFAGDAELWRHVDPTALVRTETGTRLIWIDPSAERVTDLDLSWFTNDNYDLGYQRLVGSLWAPEAGLVVVSIQRSSELVLIDPRLNQKVGVIMLAGSSGNPDLTLRSGLELLASDYDRLCMANVATGAVRCSPPLQEPTPPNTRQFIGDYDAGEATCVVARPFSGDVLRLDLETFAVLDRGPVGGQPLAVCMTSGSDFVTRDWKTGRVARGRF